MLLKKNYFELDHIKNLPVSKGLLIKKIYHDERVDIAYILWNKSINNCYIQTIADNFQTHVVVYDDFKDFIYLIDEAYRLVCMTNEQRGK